MQIIQVSLNHKVYTRCGIFHKTNCIPRHPEMCEINLKYECICNLYSIKGTFFSQLKSHLIGLYAKGHFRWLIPAQKRRHQVHTKIFLHHFNISHTIYAHISIKTRNLCHLQNPKEVYLFMSKRKVLVHNMKISY